MYPSKLGTFPPRIDLGVQPTAFTAEGVRHVEPRHHTAEVVRPDELPELLMDLRRAVYGLSEEATPQKHRVFLPAAMAAISNALWQVS